MDKEKILSDAAHKILANMPPDVIKNTTFDPITILMIISIIISLLRLIQECKKNKAKEVKAMVYDLDDDNDRRLKREVRRMLGLKNYRDYGRELVTSILVFTKTEQDDKLEELLCLDT